MICIYHCRKSERKEKDRKYDSGGYTELRANINKLLYRRSCERARACERTMSVRSVGGIACF